MARKQIMEADLPAFQRLRDAFCEKYLHPNSYVRHRWMGLNDYQAMDKYGWDIHKVLEEIPQTWDMWRVITHFCVCLREVNEELGKALICKSMLHIDQKTCKASYIYMMAYYFRYINARPWSGLPDDLEDTKTHADMCHQTFQEFLTINFKTSGDTTELMYTSYHAVYILGCMILFHSMLKDWNKVHNAGMGYLKHGSLLLAQVPPKHEIMFNLFFDYTKHMPALIKGD